MNILIIGGTGVLSSAVTKEAIKQGINVTMINRGYREALILPEVELIKSDKNDFKYIRTILNGRQFDAVMDYLCYSNEETERSYRFYSQYTKQYFFISSCAVYDTSLGKVCRENSPKVRPVWPYSVNKWASEERLMELAKQVGTYYTIIRPCVTYGDTRIPYGISPKYGYHWTLIARIQNGKPIVRWNGGVNRTNMTRVEDFAVGVVGLIGNPKAYNEAFNVCGDERPSFNDVLNILSEIIGKEVITVDVTSEFYAQQVPNRAGEILGGRSIDAMMSNEKIKSAVPTFSQSYTIGEGIRKTYKAYLDNNYQHGIDWAFDGECDRVISKWCRINHLDTTDYNLTFIDYLKTATWQNRMEYLMELKKEQIHFRALRLFVRCMRKANRLYNKIRLKMKTKETTKISRGGEF